MDLYLLTFVVIGAAALTMAWLPSLFKKLPLSYSILFIVVGLLIYQLPLGLPDPDPLRKNDIVLRLSELCVIITLMGTGIKINRKLTWQNWSVPLRLVSWTMLLCIGALAGLAYFFLDMPLASAVLLGAALAPTDPVLAADVQVGPPSEEVEDHTRFSLTAEAGLNDGMAFPFTWLAISLAAVAQGTQDGNWLTHWFTYDLLYRIVVGVAAGFLIGKAVAYLLFKLPRKSNLPETHDGFVAISTTLLVYGLTEFMHGYGFIAVFITGLTIKNSERSTEYHREMHDFTDQIERMLVVVVLILFGGSLGHGLLAELTWQGALVGLAFIFVIRPAAGMLGLIGCGIKPSEKGAISFFGIRGIGSIFYLSFAFAQAKFLEPDEVWAVAAFTILLSIITHGILATPIMNYLDKRRSPEDLKVE